MPAKLSNAGIYSKHACVTARSRQPTFRILLAGCASPAAQSCSPKPAPSKHPLHSSVQANEGPEQQPCKEQKPFLGPLNALNCPAPPLRPSAFHRPGDSADGNHRLQALLMASASNEAASEEPSMLGPLFRPKPHRVTTSMPPGPLDCPVGRCSPLDSPQAGVQRLHT